ncbi:extracellular matrix regulator RemB [Desulfofundulus sp.]|uniref:extracellular matrix regulator RemB n=1 Tax=Desulfofundulus sp. TaxID=2282750 RepID=UPI003C790E50
MFLHLGGDVIIPKKDIIAILNFRARNSAITREFLELARGEKSIHVIAEKGKEKSFVLTREQVFVSPISCSTLKKRAAMLISAED